MKKKSDVMAGIVDDIRRIYQVLTEQSQRVEYETSLTASQLWAVKILEESSPLKASDLARRMYLHPATMVGLLDRLETKSLITRTRSDKDRRVVHIELTEQGQEVVKKSPEVVQTLLVRGLEKNTLEKLNAVSAGLEEIIRILGVQELSPLPIMSSYFAIPKRRKKTPVQPQ